LAKTLTAPGRLKLLLPWLNGDLDEHFYEGRNPEPVAMRTDYAAVRRALQEFVESFDGSADAAHVRVGRVEPSAAELAFRRHAAADLGSLADQMIWELPDEPVAETDDDLSNLGAHLRMLLAQGFGDANEGDLSNLSSPLTSLRFAVRSAGRQKPAKRGTVTGGGVTALRKYRAAGAYVLQVMGPTLELVPYLVAHLLTAPNMASVKRCERQGCPHFVIAATGKQGRPSKFCSKTCGQWNREQLERQRKLRRKTS